MLKIVENLNEDFEKYLKDEIIDHTIEMPTGKTKSSLAIAEEYIFDIGINFMHRTMMRKPSDIGSFDMKFFDIGKNLASLYYKSNNRKHKLRLFKLLSYIQTSENCARYLSDVKHPARKLKNNEELQKLEMESDEEDNQPQRNTDQSRYEAGSTKASAIAQKINEICTSEEVIVRKENEFETLVSWITLAEQKVTSIV